MRQQSGLLDDPDRRRPDVVERGVIPPLGQPLPRHRVPFLRPVPQGEQRLLAAERPAGLGDGHDLLEREERSLELRGRLGEGAVVAVIPAEHRERDEHLAGVRDGGPVGELPESRRHQHQPIQVLSSRRDQTLGLVHRQGLTGFRP